MMSAPRRPNAQSGFTLIETLAAMALMGLIISVLAMITSHWLPNWNLGFARIQRSESVSIALDRISADIGAAEMLHADRQAKTIVFNGSELSVTLVRAALGPNSGTGLDLVRIAETADSDGMAVTRSRAAFAPGADETAPFGDPVVLLRTPYRVSFSYAGEDRIWKDSWQDAAALPAAVLLTVRDAVTQRTLPISRIAVIHVSASAETVCAQAEGGCADKAASPNDTAKNPSSGSGVAGR
jgi:general secretion pathway protein J